MSSRVALLQSSRDIASTQSIAAPSRHITPLHSAPRPLHQYPRRTSSPVFPPHLEEITPNSLPRNPRLLGPNQPFEPLINTHDPRLPNPPLLNSPLTRTVPRRRPPSGQNRTRRQARTRAPRRPAAARCRMVRWQRRRAARLVVEAREAEGGRGARLVCLARSDGGRVADKGVCGDVEEVFEGEAEAFRGGERGGDDEWFGVGDRWGDGARGGDCCGALGAHVAGCDAAGGVVEEVALLGVSWLSWDWDRRWEDARRGC